MQAVTDQRWHELQVKTHRERLAMTTHVQQPGATRRVLAVTAVRRLHSILGHRPDIGMPRDVQRPAVS
jgi:hypothetical protein